MDAIGFSALPGGYGNFYNVGNRGYWWSASETNSSNAYYRYMDYYGEGVLYNNDDKGGLFSVRCVKD